jgi:glyoxylase-like metal-dependent hydrolase (beta-lactamase superfamily II)
MPVQFDRRTALKLAGGTALAGLAGAGAWPVVAQEPMAETLSVGDFEITVLSDGEMPLPISVLAPKADPEELNALLEAAGKSTETYVRAVNVTLLKRDEELIVIDTGSGMNFMESTGRLTDSLDMAGIDREAVTKVVLTHGHPDHVWGLIDDFEEAPRFPNASYVIGADEWEFWMDPDFASKVPDQLVPFGLGAQRNLRPVAEQTERVGDGHSVTSGVTMISTPGHTPGHMSVMVESGGERLMVVGDALTDEAISFERPDWLYGLDQIPEQAAETRKSLLGMLVADKIRIIGYHLPWPGAGRVEAGKAGRFRYIAEG